MTKIAKNYYLFLICIVFALWGCIGRVSLTSPADGTTIQLGQPGNLSLQQQDCNQCRSPMIFRFQHFPGLPSIR